MVEKNGLQTGMSYELLIKKLDQFIRKYYLNQVLRGALITIAAMVGLFLVYAFIESQFYLSQGFRKIMFFSFISTFIALTGYLVIRPLLSYWNLGNTITHEQAAQILGNHFGNVQDKLLNILQLKKNTANASTELLLASIDQKAEQIKLVPFRQAIDLSQNKQYLRYALPPILILLFILFAAPSIIKDSTYRIINNNADFERPAPYKFVWQESDFEVVQYEDFRLTLDVQGESLPNEVFIKVDNYDYKMTKEDVNTYSYLFSNVRKETPFRVYAGRVSSEDQHLKILPKPKMIDFKVSLNYPRYTGRQSEIIHNSGDIAVPEGTTAIWTFDTKSTDEVVMTFDEQDPIHLQPSGATSFRYQKNIRQDNAYHVSLHNAQVSQGDALSFFIRSIKDEYPQISADAIQDSLEQHIYYFIGHASDDYGISKLNFVYQHTDNEGLILASGQEPVKYQIGNQTDYEYILDVQNYKLGTGEILNFYFEVYDNDQVHGAKSAKTAIMSHRKKSLEELKKEEQANEETIKDNLEASIDEAKKIQEELKKLREKMLQKQTPDWRDKKELEKLMERHEQVQKNLQEAQNAHNKNMKQQQESPTMSPEIMEKQERMQELFNEAINDEMQKLMEDIQKLMEELGKEQSIEMMEKFEKNEEQMAKDLERLKELYKQLEVEKEMSESIDKLEKLAKELEELSEKTKEENTPNENLKKEQEEINKEFEDLKEKMDELKKKNESLEYPKDMPDDAPEQMEEISDELQESEEQLEQNKSQKASQSQQKAADKMKKMASAMQQQMASGQQEQMTEDIKTLRQLLENLVTLSFNQEDLVNSVNRTVINTPKYTSLVQDQLKISNDFGIVEDTLQALSKRNPKLETYVLEKVGEIKVNLSSSIHQLEDRQKPEANQSQRTTMKNLNDLALMLSETMQQMQQQMAQSMAGSQMCQNPGQKPGGMKGNKGQSGNVPSDKISEGQGEMSEKLKEMMKKMKEGQGNSSKDFAEAAAKQAALRKALEDMAKEQQESGQGASDQLQKIIDEMDKQEVDLVNKKLDSEMLSRQQDIVTRLLEAESAQKEREYDEKRKSQEGKNVQRDFPPSMEKYIKERKSLLEQYKYVSPELRPHYKRLVDMYYKKLKSA